MSLQTTFLSALVTNERQLTDQEYLNITDIKPDRVVRPVSVWLLYESLLLT